MDSLVSYSGSSSEPEDETDEQALPGKRSFIESETRPAETEKETDFDIVTAVPSHKRYKSEHASDTASTRSTNALPLPGAILGMFADAQVTTKNDPQQHGGRIRNIPHVEGNWASYVHIPVSADDRWKSLMEELLLCLRPLNFERMEDLHVSLSRTVYIRHHWIQPLTESLKERFQNVDSCICDVGPLKVFTNDEKTRTFLSLEISDEDTNLREYTTAVDSCFQEFNLPGFYENPSFHISLLWCLGDVISQVSEKTKEKMQNIASRFFSLHTELSVFPVNRLYLKTGNKTFAFHLNNVDE